MNLIKSFISRNYPLFYPEIPVMKMKYSIWSSYDFEEGEYEYSLNSSLLMVIE